MSDFLTRMVTAAYIPASSMRPRPVAHFEPLGAPLPIEGDNFEDAPHAAESSSMPRRAESDRMQDLPPRTPSSTVDRLPVARQPQIAAAPLATPALENMAPPAPSLAAQHTAEQVHSQPAPPANPGIVAPAPVHDRADPIDAPTPAAVRKISPPAPAVVTQGERAARSMVQTAPTLASLAEAQTRSKQTVQARVPAAPPQQRAEQLTAHPAERQHHSLAAQHTIEAQPAAPASRQPALRNAAATSAAPSAQGSLSARRTASSERADQPIARENGAPDSASTAPSIRVTIGRIVIKAESGNAPKPPKGRASASGPVLSLDAYLRARQGGDK